MTKAASDFAATYGYVPPVGDMSRTEINVGLMRNIPRQQARALLTTAGADAAPETMLLAGMSEADVMKIRIKRWRAEMAHVRDAKGGR